MFFQMDDSGDPGNGILSFPEACATLRINPVPAITDQTQAGICFELHTGVHGNPVIYVNHSKRADRISRNVPAILIGPPTVWQRGDDSFKSKEAADALATVTANAAVMLQMYNAFVAVLADAGDKPLDTQDKPPPILPVNVDPPQPNPFNIQAVKEYVFNETGNIMIAKTALGAEDIESAARDVFSEVSVFFAAMTRAISTTINKDTKQPYSIFDIQAIEGIIEGSGLFVKVTSEQVTHTASGWGVTFSKDLIEALLGLSTGTGELAFAQALISSIGSRGLTIGASSSATDNRVGSILFVCEYLFGMPIVSALVVWIDSKAEQQSFTLGPCVKESSQSVTLNMTKDTYMFVTPKFIKQYSGDLLSVEENIDYMQFVDYLQDLVKRTPIIQAVETMDGKPAGAKLVDGETYALLGAFLDNGGAPGVVAKFISPPTGTTATVTIGEVQPNAVTFVVSGTLSTACMIGLYASASATDPYVTAPIAFTVG